MQPCVFIMGVTVVTIVEVVTMADGEEQEGRFLRGHGQALGDGDGGGPIITMVYG